LGLGRAPGTDPTTAIALRGSRAALMADEFPEQLAQLVAFGQGDAQGRLRSVTAYPKDVPLPRIWLLGSSGYSSVLAAKLGLGFGFAAHFSPDPPEPPLLGYREQFRPSETFPKPHAILTVSAICAHTQLEAERLAMSMQLAWVRLRTGVLSTIASPEEALAYPYTEQDRLVMQAYRQMQIVGTPASVRSSIEGLAARTRADEVMITTVTHDPQARLTSYELLAEAFGLPRSARVVPRLSS
jgi:luciferase family oxidoreductase group 1